MTDKRDLKFTAMHLGKVLFAARQRVIKAEQSGASPVELFRRRDDSYQAWVGFERHLKRYPDEAALQHYWDATARPFTRLL